MVDTFPLCCCLVVSTSAIDCLERLISEMTYYVSSRTLNHTHSLTVLCVKWNIKVCWAAHFHLIPGDVLGNKGQLATLFTIHFFCDTDSVLDAYVSSLFLVFISFVCRQSSWCNHSRLLGNNDADWPRWLLGCNSADYRDRASYWSKVCYSLVQVFLINIIKQPNNSQKPLYFSPVIFLLFYKA